MNLRSSVAVVVCLGLSSPLVSCRKAPKPSPEFDQASRTFSQLYAQELDDAYLDPKMAEVEALLEKVPGESMDGARARDLAARIRDNRARMQAEAAAREQVARPELGGPVSFSNPFTGPDAGIPLKLTPDAGALVDRPRIGMTVSEFESRFSRCFERGQELFVEGRGKRDSYQLVDLAICRQLYPDFAQILLLAGDGKIEGMADRGSVRQVQLPVDAGTP